MKKFLFNILRDIRNLIILSPYFLMLLVFFTHLIFTADRYEEFIPANAKIVEITKDDHIYVTFNVEDLIYTTEAIGYYNESYQVGDIIQVNHNKYDPNEVTSAEEFKSSCKFENNIFLFSLFSALINLYYLNKYKYKHYIQDRKEKYPELYEDDNKDNTETSNYLN